MRLLVHPEPIKVCYQRVRKLVPELWHLDEDRKNEENADAGEDEEETEVKPKIDFAIHIGMAGPTPNYSIERRGHRDGYSMKDVCGEFLKDQPRKVREGKDWAFDGVPAELETDLDLDDVLQRWKANCPASESFTVSFPPPFSFVYSYSWPIGGVTDAIDQPDHKLRISEDAGRYLCDFIYFSSLAHLTKNQRPRKVVFFHVPSTAKSQNIHLGRTLLLELVKSIAQSEVAHRERMEAAQMKGKPKR